MPKTLYQDYFNELNAASSKNSQNTSSIEEPNWMISIGQGEDKFVTKSSLSEPLENFAYIYDYQFVMNRGIESAASHTIKPNGGLAGHDLNVIVPSSSINATLNLLFFENEEIPNMSLARVGILNKKLDILEEYIFTTCYISGMLTKGDILAISFRYSTIERKNNAFNQKGVKGGAHIAQHSFINSSSKA